MIDQKGKANAFGSLTSFVRRSLRRSSRGANIRSSLKKDTRRPMMPTRNFIVVNEFEFDDDADIGFKGITNDVKVLLTKVTNYYQVYRFF